MPIMPPEVKLVWSEGFPSVSGYYFAWDGEEIRPVYFCRDRLASGNWPFKKITSDNDGDIWPNYPNAFTHAWTHFAPMPGKAMR